MSRKNRTLMSRLPLFLIAIVLSLAAFSGVGWDALRSLVVFAASPASGTISPSTPTVNYGGGPFNSINQTDTADTATIVCTPATPCDDYALAVSIPAGDTNTYIFTVTVSWTDKATVDSSHNDFDAFVYDSKGNVVSGSSAATSSNPEKVSISVKDTNYTIRVLPFDVNTGPSGDTYSATITLAPVPGAPVFPPPPPTLPGVPRYQNYAAPNGLGTTAGEPSMGVDWATGKVFIGSNLQTLRVTFDDCSSPAKTTWEDKSAPTSQESLDPILFTDHNGLSRDRTFVSELTGQDSLTSFTDDDGENWTPSQGGGIPSGVDHQTIGGGPYRTDLAAIPPVAPPPHPTYPNVIYYCSQEVAASFCARSDNGGQTFGAGVPIWTTAQCGGIHGHVKVAPDGTVYVPNKSCGGKQGFSMSRDNGVNWTVVTDPGSTATSKLVDPSVGIGKNGTVYFAYEGGADGSNSYPPRVAVAKVASNGTVTWSHDQLVGGNFNIKNAVFPEAISSAFNPSAVNGDDDRAAIAFLGTTAAGDYTNTSFTGSWHLFVATTFDGGATWTTADATPNDPVQRGSICTLGTTSCNHTPDDRNLLDFMDMTIDRQGRVLVGYADGCIGGCVNGTENSFTQLASIARQSGGKRIIAAFDPPEPTLPGAPVVTAISDATGIHLSWPETDNGGSPITNYKVYRRPQGASQKTLIANVGTSLSFDDLTADPTVKYFYSVRAVNAIGEGPFCGEVSAVALPTVNPCNLPGASLVTDPTGDAKPPNPALDIEHVWVAEPFDPANPNTNKLVWTMKVASLSTVPPNSQWYIIWDFGKGARRYVAMLTDASGTPSFRYGHVGPALDPTNPDPAANKPFDDGPADSGSVTASGTIRITISDSKVTECIPTGSDFTTCTPGGNAPKAGSTIANISPRTFSGSGATNVTGSSATDSTSNTPAYTLVGNSFCRPNNAPIARLTASPTVGPAPLTVHFNASASSDPDAGDGIAAYIFDFGDTFVSQQSSPTTSHVYTANGTYQAKLYVRDTRGKLSLSPATVTITVSTVPPPAGTVRLGAANFSIAENSSHGFVTVSFVREGSTTGAASVRFSTSDGFSLNSPCSKANTGKASQRCDYATSVGRISWASGEGGTKTVKIPIINDAYPEGNEVFNITLTNPSGGVSLGSPGTATVTILDDDTSLSNNNPIDGVDFFITQQYIDFLGRMPDPIGFQNWHNTLAPCPNGGFGEPPTSDCDRLHVAAGFFQSDEFLDRGYWAFRFYMVSYNQRPTYAQFIPDMAEVGGPKSPAEEEASKVVFADAFVQRPEFVAKYGGLSGQALANALLHTAGLPSGSYNAGSQTNGQILRGIAETSAVFNKFLTEGTVSIQYFGFLRRDPDTLGYQNNLKTLKANPNNLRHMIFIFIYSTEYRGRFGKT